MFGVIAWRLDILFANEIDKPIIANNDNIQQSNNEPNLNQNSEPDNDISTENNVHNIDNDSNINDTENTTSETDQSQAQENEEQSTEAQDVIKTTIDAREETNKVITVVIPKGALPNKIADILLDNDLIDSKKEFLNKAQELELDTKLQSGEFKIKESSSLESIIKIIARKK